MILSLVALLLAAVGAGRADDATFERVVRPVLAAKCVACHNAKAVSGGVRLDQAISAAVAARVQAAIRYDGKVKMPPAGKLPATELAALESWVKAGAPWPKATMPSKPTQPLWSLQPVRTPTLPTVKNTAWVRKPIDRFILAKLEAAGKRASGEADRRTWLRRVSYDLTGLPPTTAELDVFLADKRPEAYERVVERLLASPAYGEQWGRHWLDIVRYADTAGENSDHPLPHAWRYRNWVIAAFNANKPYDQFVKEQLAGDLLAGGMSPERYADGVIATGYLAIARRFGHEIDQDMHLTYEDTIDTLGKSFLGLTVGCARCHDHKFDPVTQKDYYGLYGILSSTRFAYPGCEPQQRPRDLVPLVAPEELARRTQAVQAKLAALETESKARTTALPERGRALEAEALKAAAVLTTGTIDDGGAKDWPTLPPVRVRKGEVLLLTITPRSNHGADTTWVTWKIAEQGGGGRLWQLADLVADLPAGNPHADRFGNAAVWSFLDAQRGWLFLPERLEAIDGQPALKAWRNGDTPAVVVNTSDQPVKVWTTLPPRSVFAHPGPNGPVTIAWTSPIDGTVALSGTIADAHPGGPDGVGWELRQVAAATVGTALAALGAESAALQETARQKRALQQELAVPVAYAVTEGKPQNARLQKRGEPADLGDEVPRKFLAVLGDQRVQNAQASGRAELAEWIASPRNPLTARVFVNRVWQHHFGRGLVKTPNDFGTRGQPPTHPALLDWLADQFVKSGWDIKALHRQVVLSATYRTAPGDATDLYLAFPRRRLSAEELRDTLLQVSGELDRTQGGPHPFPPEASWSFTQHQPFAAEYETLQRSVYVMQKRNRRLRFFALFDGPDPNASTPVRDRTTVPTQALYFMNDPFVHQRAAKLAERMAHAGATPRQQLTFAYREALGRWPTTDELTEGEAFLKTYPTPEQARAAFARVLLSSNAFLYLD